MPVRTHDQQIGANLSGVVHNLRAGARTVTDGGFDVDLHLAQRSNQTIQIFRASLDFWQSTIPNRIPGW